MREPDSESVHAMATGSLTKPTGATMSSGKSMKIKTSKPKLSKEPAKKTSAAATEKS